MSAPKCEARICEPTWRIMSTGRRLREHPVARNRPCLRTFAVICVASLAAIAFGRHGAGRTAGEAREHAVMAFPLNDPAELRAVVRLEATLVGSTRAPNFTRHVSTENRRAMSQQIAVTNHFGGCPKCGRILALT
jgi:hypothetical protein